MRNTPWFLALAVFFFAFFPSLASALSVFHNGHIRLSVESPIYDWIAVEKGRIVDYGLGRNFARLKPNNLIDLKSHFVLPGLTDSHAHIVGNGQRLSTVDLRGCKSSAEAVSRLRKFLDAHPNADPIFGMGWDQSDWPDQAFPERTQLDAIGTTASIILYRVDAHAVWVNTTALTKAGLLKSKEDPAGGKIIRDNQGNPTGVLVDAAMSSMGELGQNISTAAMRSAIEATVAEALSYGITSLHDAGASRTQIEAIEGLLREKKVNFRFYEMVKGSDEESLAYFLNRGPVIDAEDGRFSVRTIKYYADGAMGSRGAAFDEPYDDAPGNRGNLLMTSDQMKAAVKKAQARGFQLAFHGIGSRANHLVLDAFESLGASARPSRPRLEHAQVLTAADIDRMARLGVVASMQPTHCTSDMKWVVDRIGEKRARYAYAWKSLFLRHVPLAFGSDAPVESLNPWLGLFAAITRQDEKFRPAGGFFPQERLSFPMAFQAFTSGAAYASFHESSQGTLDKGKVADFFMTSTDPFKASPRELRKIMAEETYVGGERVFQRKSTDLIH